MKYTDNEILEAVVAHWRHANVPISRVEADRVTSMIQTHASKHGYPSAWSGVTEWLHRRTSEPVGSSRFPKSVNLLPFLMEDAVLGSGTVHGLRASSNGLPGTPSPRSDSDMISGGRRTMSF